MKYGNVKRRLQNVIPYSIRRAALDFWQIAFDIFLSPMKDENNFYIATVWETRELFNNNGPKGGP